MLTRSIRKSQQNDRRVQMLTCSIRKSQQNDRKVQMLTRSSEKVSKTTKPLNADFIAIKYTIYF